MLLERSPAGTFAVFAAACAAGYAWATRCVPETGGVALEEIDAVFGSDAARADAALKREVCVSPPSLTIRSLWAPPRKLMRCRVFLQIEVEVGLHDLVQRWAGHRTDHNRSD